MKNPFSQANIGSLGRTRGWAGVFFDANEVQMTAVRPSGTELAIQREETVPLTDDTWAQAGKSLRAQVDPGEYRIITAVGCEDVLCHTLSLPATEPGELRQMLELQMDNLTPLPAEEVVYSFESLGATGQATRVLVAVANKAAVNRRVAALEEAGLPAEVVGVDALAVFDACRKRGLLARDGKLNAFVLLQPGVAHVVAYVIGEPVTVRSLVTGAMGREELCEELRRTLVSAGAARTECGGVTFAAFREDLRSEVEALASAWAGPVTCLVNGQLPAMALSLCGQAAARGETGLNLLPEEWRQRRRQKHVKRMLIRGGIAVAVLYLIVAGVFLGLMGWRQSDLNLLKAATAKRQGPVDEARTLRNTLLAMERQLDQKYSALETLRVASELLPEGLKLNSFEFKRDLTLTLRGEGSSASVVNDYIARLEKCDLFGSVKTISEKTEPTGLTKFDVLCGFRNAPPGTGGR